MIKDKFQVKYEPVICIYRAVALATIPSRRRLINPEHLLVLMTETLFTLRTIQYMDFVEIFNVLLDLYTIYFILVVLVGAELPLCIVVIVVTPSYNAIACFLESS